MTSTIHATGSDAVQRDERERAHCSSRETRPRKRGKGPERGLLQRPPRGHSHLTDRGSQRPALYLYVTLPGSQDADWLAAAPPHGRDDDVPDAGGQRKRVLLPAQTHRRGRETGSGPRRGPTRQTQGRSCKGNTPPPGSRVSAEPSVRTNGQAGIANTHSPGLRAGR